MIWANLESNPIFGNHFTKNYIQNKNKEEKIKKEEKNIYTLIIFLTRQNTTEH